MDGATIQSVGSAVGIIIVAGITFRSMPGIISALKGGNALENNTKAITELTQFLQTQAAVDKEKAKQSEKDMTEVKDMLTNITNLITTHSVKCDSTCRGPK